MDRRREWAEERGLVFVGHESIKDDEGVDQLQLLINELQAKVDDEPEEKSIFDSDSEDEKQTKAQVSIP